MILPAPTSNLDMVVCAGPDGAESSRSEPPITIIGAVRGTRRIVILLIDEYVKRTWPRGQPLHTWSFLRLHTLYLTETEPVSKSNRVALTDVQGREQPSRPARLCRRLGGLQESIEQTERPSPLDLEDSPPLLPRLRIDGRRVIRVGRRLVTTLGRGIRLLLEKFRLGRLRSSSDLSGVRHCALGARGGQRQ